jgi:Fur family transcriptional regulator, peroxide stress response regulator
MRTPTDTRARMPATLESLCPQEADAVLRDALEANGQRFTDQRAAVYRFLRGSTEHPTAEEVFTHVRGDIADISLATVYKALETLVTCGLAVKMAYGDDCARYDARTDDHYHSRCMRCGMVRDVPAEVPAAIAELHAGDGFRVEGYRVEVLGYCAGCAA